MQQFADLHVVSLFFCRYVMCVSAYQTEVKVDLLDYLVKLNSLAICVEMHLELATSWLALARPLVYSSIRKNCLNYHVTRFIDNPNLILFKYA